jgi:hypothetical protein
MAKLSARNRQELARFSKEYHSGLNNQVVWARTTYAYMSDNRLLRKRDVRFAPNENLGEKEPVSHSYGWKEDRVGVSLEAVRTELLAQGFTEV